MRGMPGKQEGWLLPFCLIYLVVGTTLIINELDRATLLLRQMNRITEREQDLVDMEADLREIQQSNRSGDPFNELPVTSGGGEARWLFKQATYTIMVPASLAQIGRCQSEIELIFLTALPVGSERKDGWSVYFCEWFESGHQALFYVPQTHW